MQVYKQLHIADNDHRNQKMYSGECKFLSSNFDQSFESRFSICAEKFDRAIIVIGGSHAMDAYNAIAMNTKYPFVIRVARGACRAHRFYGASSPDDNCQYDDFLTFLNQYNKQISMVVYTQTPDRLFPSINLHESTISDLNTSLVDEVVSYLNKIKTDYNIDVLMLGMMPPLLKSPIEWDYSQSIENQYDEIISSNSVHLSKMVDLEFETRLKKIEIPYVSKIEALRLSLPEDLLINGRITYSDRRHISEAGELEFGKRLVESLRQKGFNDF